MIAEQGERGAVSAGNEARYLREEIQDLQVSVSGDRVTSRGVLYCVPSSHSMRWLRFNVL